MKLHDEKGPTILGMVLGFFAFSVIVFLITSLVRTAHARDRLNLSFSIAIQYEFGEEWITSKELKSVTGLGGLQFHIDPEKKYRMVIKVPKPHDIKGTFRARSATRVDGVVVPPDSTEGVIIFGPQPSCNTRCNELDTNCLNTLENRCAPLSLDDVGLVEMRLDLEKASETAIGAANVRPYDKAPPIPVRASIRYKEGLIQCDSTVDKGWWIFAKKLVADSDSLTSISLCVTTPANKTLCADDREFDLKIKANQKGTYRFEVWNDKGIGKTCLVHAK